MGTVAPEVLADIDQGVVDHFGQNCDERWVEHDTEW